MICLDWWVFELLVLIAGYLGEAELAATVIVMNLFSFPYNVNFGFEVAMSTFIGWYIGKSDIATAKRYYHMFIKM